MTHIPTLAYEVAEKLDNTTDDLSEFCHREGNEKYAECDDNMDFLKRFDALIFMCTSCGWWKRQRENATPDASEWQCQECFREDHPCR